jgi:hypothetical protein
MPSAGLPHDRPREPSRTGQDDRDSPSGPAWPATAPRTAALDRPPDRATATSRSSGRPCGLRHAEGTACASLGADQGGHRSEGHAFHAGHAGSIPVTRSTYRPDLMLVSQPRGAPTLLTCLSRAAPSWPLITSVDRCLWHRCGTNSAPSRRHGRSARIARDFRNPRQLPLTHIADRRRPNQPGWCRVVPAIA